VLAVHHAALYAYQRGAAAGRLSKKHTPAPAAVNCPFHGGLYETENLRVCRVVARSSPRLPGRRISRPEHPQDQGRDLRPSTGAR
jgi:hypothetical protein